MTKAWPLLTWFGLTIAASLALYHTSDRVNTLERRLGDLDAQIESEQQSIHVLKAEWVYLANPARVESEATRHLGLAPTPPARVIAMNDIGSVLPLRAGVTMPTPVQSAENMPAPRTSGHHGHYAALENGDGHVNDRIVIERGAAAPPGDGVESLIGAVGLDP